MKIINLTEISETSVSHNAEIKKKVLIGNKVIPHLTNFSQATFLPGQIAPVHTHADMYEVFFVVSGSGTITVNNSPVKLLPGLCVVIEPGDDHEVRADKKSTLVLSYFGIAV